MHRSIDKSALGDANSFSYWNTYLPNVQRFPSLIGSNTADLVVAGGGFTGLWSAILAKDQHPHLDVLVLDSATIGSGASSRNGGFISESITHGHGHGSKLWPNEMDLLVQLGRENFRAIADFLESEKIEASLHQCGKRVVATALHHLPALNEAYETQMKLGERAEVYDQARAQAEIHSPTYLGAIRIYTGGGLVNPAALILGLVESAQKRGIRIYENSHVAKIENSRKSLTVVTPEGSIVCEKVVLATNAFTPLLKRIQQRVLPLFEHVLTTEKIPTSQLTALGWQGSEGVTDMGNQFHYYRKTDDGRILWGGYDARYYYGNDTSPAHENHSASHELLAAHFYETFPSLADVRFEYKWAGMIDATSRFTPYFGTAYSGKLSYAVGFTGLGVGASRFGAQICTDMLYRTDSPLLDLEMVRKKPIPFPPEPLRFPTVEFTRRALQWEDATGSRGTWLKVLDYLHLGLNS